MRTAKGCVAALGTFDGVHLGHKKVISKAAAFAKKTGLPCIVVTFHPHPKSVVNPLRKPLLLTTVEERAMLMNELGINAMAVLTFDKELENTGYKDFARKTLKDRFKARAVFIGRDYAFGRGREGNPFKLKKLGVSMGFLSFPVADKELAGTPVKSTLIRTLLREGHFSRAIRLLGHPYMIAGTVVPGYGRGRELGYPTANVKTESDKLIPKSGVYAGEAVINGKKFDCVVNIGSRPTFGARDITVEAHLLGFDGDISGRNITLFLKRRLRDEKKFKSVKALIRAIKADIGRVRPRRG